VHPKNTKFNLHVSKLRIRSEHAIGFLKGRFPSLKGLRLQINHADMHRIATYWIAACIAVHMFAFRVEREERGDDDEDYLDPFIEEGETSSSSPSASASGDSGSDSNSHHASGQHAQGRSGLLTAAKRFRSTLKHKLLRAQGRNRARRGAGA
jgi:hypothetical protein